MARYTVTFFKDLLSSCGTLVRCMQRCVEIRGAASPADAAVMAQRKFKRSRGGVDWRLYADLFEVTAVSEHARRSVAPATRFHLTEQVFQDNRAVAG
jgi:hypothetical protein